MDIVRLMGKRTSMKIGVKTRIIIGHGVKIKIVIKANKWTGIGIRFK